MTLLDNLKTTMRAPKAGDPLAPTILAQLTEAEATLAEMEARRGDAALSALLDSDDVALPTLLEDIEAQASFVRNLRAAHATAVQRDGQADAERRAAAHAAQIKAVRQHVKARDDAATGLTVAVMNMARAWATLGQVNAKIAAALPEGTPTPPADTLLAFGSLKAAVQQELMRLGHGEPSSVGSYPGALPGAAVGDFRLAGAPDELPAFDRRVKDAGAYLMATLTGKTLPTAPAPQAPAEPEPPPEARDFSNYVPPRRKLA